MKQKTDLEEIKSFLINAINNVPSKYYVHYHRKEKLFKFANERVFAYELYYQLRKIQENGEFESDWLSSEDLIQGELYKIGANIQKYPDLIFHKQGDDSRNMIVIEIKVVKNTNFDEDGILKDFDTFKIMRKNLGFKYMFELIICTENSFTEISEFIDKYKPDYVEPIYCYWKLT